MIIPVKRVLTIRCSALDLLMTCSESSGISIEGDEIIIDSTGEPARLGQALHRWAEHLDDPEKQPDISELAERFSVDVDDLQVLASLCKRFYHDHLKRILHGFETEIEYEMEIPFGYHGYTHIRLTGKIDMLKVKGNRVHVNDWKSGRLETSCVHQQRGYATLALHHHKECDQAWSAVSYLQHNYFFAGDKILTRSDLDSWVDDLVWSLRNGIGKFNPGPHCGYCQRQHSCIAREKWARSALATFQQDGVEIRIDGPPDVVGPQLADALATVKYLRNEGERLKDIARKYAEDHGGEFPTGRYGMRYELRKKTSKSIDPLKGWPVLDGHLKPHELAPCVKIRKGKIEKALSAKREKGSKGEYIDEVMNELEAKGAMIETTTHELRETR